MYLNFLSDFLAQTCQTKADLARHVGVTNSAVSDWFKRDDMRLSTALRILDKYNCDIKFHLVKPEALRFVPYSMLNSINISDVYIAKKRLFSLKQSILASGWTMKRTASSIGIAPETLSYYWSTDDCPISVFYKVADILGYNVIYSIDQKNDIKHIAQDMACSK